MKAILFTLENCPKCDATKEYLKGIDYECIKFPHNYKKWTDEQKELAQKYGILKELQVTAPLLVLVNYKDEIIIGQMRIKKWVSDIEKD